MRPPSKLRRSKSQSYSTVRRQISLERPRPRQVDFERLEARLLLVVGANAAPAPLPTGTQYDGVVQLGSSIGPCTGSLLYTGEHILTAAHCVDDNNDGVSDNVFVTVFFDVPGSTQPVRM